MDLIDLETELEKLLCEVDKMPELNETQIYLIKVKLSKCIHQVAEIRKNEMRVLEVRI